MNKILVVFLALMLCFAVMPHPSEAKGFGGSRGFSRHITVPRSTFRTPRGTSSFGRSLATHATAFGLGALVGHMFHPFGGYYGGGMYGFSFFGILLDVVIILVIIWLIKRIFTRRRY